jgi:type IV secretion system protein TrbE
MQHLMQTRAAVVPVLTYLFHRLEKRFDGSPTLIVLDEAWLYLTESYFAAKVREWLKVLRKQNVAVVFATQSLSDIADSPIAPAIVENCLTRVFLPNAAAMEERTRRIYESFGLNDRQLAILQQAIPKRDYYYQSREGNRLFELGLGPIQLALCAAGTPEDLARIDRVLAAFGTDNFAGHYFDALELRNGAIDQAFSCTQQDERKQHAHDTNSTAVAQASVA